MPDYNDTQTTIVKASSADHGGPSHDRAESDADTTGHTPTMSPPPTADRGLTAGTRAQLSGLRQRMVRRVDDMFPKPSELSGKTDIDASLRASIKAGFILMEGRLGMYLGVAPELRGRDCDVRRDHVRLTDASYDLGKDAERWRVKMSKVLLNIECVPTTDTACEGQPDEETQDHDDASQPTYVTLSFPVQRDVRSHEWRLRADLARLTADNMPYSRSVLLDAAAIPSTNNIQADRYVLSDLCAGVQLAKATRTAVAVQSLSFTTLDSLSDFVEALDEAFGDMLIDKADDEDVEDLKDCILKGSEYLSHQPANAIAATNAATNDWGMKTLSGNGASYDFTGMDSWTPFVHDWPAGNIFGSLEAVSNIAREERKRLGERDTDHSFFVALQPFMVSVVGPSGVQRWGDAVRPSANAVLAIREDKEGYCKVDPEATQIVVDGKVVTVLRNLGLSPEDDHTIAS